MKVICLYNEILDSLAKKLNLSKGIPRLYKSISPGKEYIVLGLTYRPSEACYAGYPVIEIKNDTDGISIVPLFMFEVVDPSASRHWLVKFEQDTLKILPKSFYSNYYHDDLSEGIPEVVEDFKRVCKIFELESNQEMTE